MTCDNAAQTFDQWESNCREVTHGRTAPEVLRNGTVLERRSGYVSVVYCPGLAKAPLAGACIALAKSTTDGSRPLSTEKES